MSSFEESVRTHLARYKQQELGVSEDGVWAGNGVAYPHILPEPLREQNVLSWIRDDVFTLVAQRGIALHRDFHHLNSSQALCFNLFFPFFHGPEAEPAPLLEALGMPARPVESWALEQVEDETEGTNFDFFTQLQRAGAGDVGPRVYVEVKFTEQAFGSCANDERHRAKLDEIYRSRLAGKVTPDALEPKLFCKHYQFWRNVAYADPARAATVVFLVPRGNTSLQREWKRVSAHLTDGVRPAVRRVFVEDVIARLVADAPRLGTRLAEYIPLLAAKYGVT